MLLYNNGNGGHAKTTLNNLIRLDNDTGLHNNSKSISKSKKKMVDKKNNQIRGFHKTSRHLVCGINNNTGLGWDPYKW